VEIDGRRTLIIEAARQLVVSDGYEAMSIRRVASAAGVTTKTLYAYFPSKRDLLRFLWMDVFAVVFDNLSAAARSKGTPKQKLAKISTAYVRYWIEHPDQYRMVFMSHGVSQATVTDFLFDSEIAVRFAVFAKSFAAASARPAPRELATTSEVLVCALHGLAHCRITISGYAWSDLDNSVSVLIDGLLRGPTA
jgi:AcrR family transcriptional regulator